MSLLCPACNRAMHEVATATTNGYAVAVDQCPACGGVWCDHWELYPLRTDAAIALDKFDRTTFEATTLTKDAVLKCPRCSLPLRHWNDAAWPVDANVARCVTCEGLWLNRGELTRIKSKQVDRKTHAELPSAPIVVHDLDSALHSETYEDFSSPKPAYLWSAGVWVAARLLVRALFGL